MSVFITDEKVVEEYFQSPALNQSKLKLLRFGMDHFRENVDKDITSEAMKIGRAVDLILTGRPEEYERKYLVTDIAIPGGVVGDVVRTVFENVDQADIKELGDYEEMIGDILKEIDWYKSRTLESRISSVIKDGGEYFKFLKQAQNKEVVDSDFNQKVQDFIRYFNSNSLTSRFLDKNRLSHAEHTDFFFQVPIYFTKEGEDCKCLLDLVIANKDATGKYTNIIPVDFKTTSAYLVNFEDVAINLGYDLQACWYTEALMSRPVTTTEDFKKVLDDNPEVGNFLFMVASSSSKSAWVFEADKEYLKCAVQDYSGRNGKEILGLESLLKLYKFYKETEWEIDVAFYGKLTTTLKHPLKS